MPLAGFQQSWRKWKLRARVLFKEALDRDPNYALAWVGLADTEYLLSQWGTDVVSPREGMPRAKAAAQRALAISPTANTAHRTLGEVLLARKRPEAALAEFLKEPYEADHLDGSAMAYFAMGRKTDSDAALAGVIKSHPDDAFGIAEIYAFRGESDESFKWLDRAYAQKDFRLPFIKGDRLFTNVEGDPRFKSFLRKLNLPD